MTASDNSAITVVERIKRDFKVINLGIFFDEATAAWPDSVAIIDLTEDEPRTYSYGELEREARRAALALRAAGLRSRERLIVSIPNGVRFLSAFLGALRIGVIPVPINFRLGADALATIVRAAFCRAILGSPRHT
jgi:acyl-CoA synthetase (AMP-forming)/AMP-acid ligase II